MIDRTHQLPIGRQCQLLRLARSTAYYQPRPVSDTTLMLMRRIDELHLQYPFAVARMLRDLLRHEGHAIGRRRVATLMRRMGITVVYRTPRISQRHPAHRIYPYLPLGLDIVRPNHAWAADITSIPMASRLHVSLRRPGLGESPSARLAALRYADDGLLPRRGAGGDHAVWLPRDLQHRPRVPVHQPRVHGAPEPSRHSISMDGKGCWRDNVFVERLWKSIKCEEVYVHAYETAGAAHQGLARYLMFYNQTRPHQALDGQTPDQVYSDNLTTRRTAVSSAIRQAPPKEWSTLSNQPEPPLRSPAAFALQWVRQQPAA